MSPPLDARFTPIGDVSHAHSMIACALLPLDTHGRLILQFRDNWNSIEQPATWCPFGGGLENDEALDVCCVREFEEETGVRLSQQDLTPYSVSVGGAPNFCTHYLFTYARPIAIKDISVREGAGFAAFDKSQLTTLNITPNMRAPIEHFVKHVMT